MGEDELNQVDRTVLETAFRLSVGALSTYGEHVNKHPQQLMNEIIHQAVVVLQDSN